MFLFLSLTHSLSDSLSLSHTGGLGIEEPTYRSNAREVVGPQGKLIRICLADDTKVGFSASRLRASRSALLEIETF